MASSADVMIHVADSMGALAPTLLENGDAATRVLAQHWNLDAHALRDQLMAKFPSSDYTARAQALVYRVEQGIAIYGTDRD